jgi:hypothetical protein
VVGELRILANRTDLCPSTVYNSNHLIPYGIALALARLVSLALKARARPDQNEASYILYSNDLI